MGSLHAKFAAHWDLEPQSNFDAAASKFDWLAADLGARLSPAASGSGHFDVLRLGTAALQFMESLDQIKSRAEAAVPGARIGIVPNASPSGQSSFWVDSEHAFEVARFLRDDPLLRLDYASNVTGVDWLDTIIKEKVKVRKIVGGVESEVEETQERKRPGYLEAVYHLYSISLRHGPIIMRLRTENRTDRVHIPSMTPLWRGAEFQEREIFDLYGIVFDGHPDLRRILMWEGFADHPMRKDYVEADDYEYEPTPHDDVLEKAKRHYPSGTKA